MYGQFQLVLVGVSVLAGLIGAFVVYNAVSLSVVERAKEIGTLRALGARRGEILLAFTLEAALLGAAASLLGCLAGQFVAERAMSQAATSLSMFLNLGPLRHVVPGDIWLLGPLVGVVTTLFGAFIPARAAALQPPVATLKLGELRQAGPRRTLLWFVSSALLLSVAAWLIHRRESSWTAHVGAVALGYLALALVGPALIHWGLRPIARLAGRLMPLPAWLAIDNIVQFPTRTSLTSITLGGTLALVIALSGWVVSVQADLDRWMDDVFVFDLSMQLNDLSATPYPRGTIAAGVLDAVRRDPRCAAAYGVRAVFVPFHGREVMLLAIESQALLDGRIARGRSRDVEADRRAAAAMQHGAIGVSTNFATLYGVRAGDRVTIPTPKGNQEFTVAEVRTDYSWMHGVVTLDLGTFRSLWEDDGLSYVDIRVTPGEDVEAFRTDLSQRLAAPLGAYVHRADEIQSAARRLMREWFRLADVQLLLALIIGGAGVANTLLISVLTQSRQIALLRAIGAQAAQIRRTLMAEAAGLGLIGALAGWGLGLATIHFALAPISAHTSGYVFPLVTPWATLAKTTAAALAIALGAALLPLRAVRRLDLVAAIGYE
jgi:putative ABC transport system permease protein